MGPTVDLVADLGEGFGAYSMGDDAALLEVVSSANIACGFHAGDPDIMNATVAECVRRGVSIGAHPSFPDLRGFGRRAMDLTADEIRNDVLYQLGALSAFAAYHGTSVAHIAPHGRLGNLVATRADYAAAVADAAWRVNPGLIVLAQDGELAAAAAERQLPVAIVGIADRAYEADGTLVPRGRPGAVIHDPSVIVERTVRMVCEGLIETVAGTDLPIVADTVLLHGDTPGAVQLARRVRAELEIAGVAIAPLARVLAAKEKVA
jgi:5-oxoprolinase (ATP-hydrolysing) subunit A